MTQQPRGGADPSPSAPQPAGDSPAPEVAPVHPTDTKWRTSIERQLARQAELLELAHDPILILNLDNVITFWNRAAEETYGWTREEALGQKSSVLLRTCFPAPLDDVLRSVRERGVWEGELTHTRRDGATVIVDSRWALQRGQEDEPDAIIEINHDVTPNRLAMARLAESEERFRQAADSMAEGLLVVDDEGRYVLCNQSALRILGTSIDQVIGRSAFEDTWSATRDDGSPWPADGRPILAALRTGQRYREPAVRVRRPDGRLVWLAIDAAPMYRPGDARPFGAVATFADITDKRAQERALKERMLEMETLMDTLPVAVFVAHDPECRQITANRAGRALLRLSPGGNASLSADEAERPAHFRAVRDGKELAAEELPIQYAAAHGVEVREAELDHVYDDGTVVSFYGYASPLFDADGRVRGAVGVFVDISERRRAEEQLRAHQAEIEDLNARLRQSVRETHHRIKNNLQVIAAMVDMQTMEPGDTVPASELERLAAHVRTLAAVHDILTNEARGGPASDLPARPMLDQLLNALQQVNAGRALHAELDDVRLSTRQATSLALVTTELVSNAIKHGSGPIAVRFRASGEDAELEVLDDGPGFPADFSAESAANTGLDLVESLSRWDLGGETFYENRPEGGAQVRVTFTIKPA